MQPNYLPNTMPRRTELQYNQDVMPSPANYRNMQQTLQYADEPQTQQSTVINNI